MTTKQKKLTAGFLLLFIAAYLGTGSAPWMVWTILALGYLGAMFAFRNQPPTTNN